MALSLTDFQDFVLLWIQKRTGVHHGEQLLIYPAMVRHCLCCHASGTYARSSSGLCPKCCEDQVCLLCTGAFVPSAESVGVFCPTCWTRLETTWKTTFEGTGVAGAESEIRSMLLGARPRLTGCDHPTRR